MELLLRLCVWLAVLCQAGRQTTAEQGGRQTTAEQGTDFMPETERTALRDEAEDMFFHAYNAYMEVAWPADELMPLSCKGRYRGREAGRGDIDEALGNFSLTLIDSLDMLVVLGRIEEFEDAVLKVVETVRFDTDVVVSVFETNIRIVGGLVSGHVLAEYVRDKSDKMSWYSGELLNMALDIGTRLLPAFNTTTGLPYPRVNLKTGLKGVSNQLQLTCTACAGTMILEFAALSRLSGESVFEEVASKAMDYLWTARHRQSNLVGAVLNVNTGDWVRRESGVGAGIDSYYEYVAKAYVLLGEDKYLDRWNTHYSAVMKYMNNGPLMVDVHMHRPTTNSKHFVDALGAFLPGLQVLMGDLKPAIEQHEILYQVTKMHSFLPEAITADFQVHWGQHFLRPEFVESTYFLYKATKDPHYLQVGKKVLKALQTHARVTCGYAAVKDVRTMTHEDRLDSFVLSETFKYLYLLFAKEEELYLDINQFVFTTEAHLFPLSLARLSNSTVVPVKDEYHQFLPQDEDVEFALSCPSTRYMFPDHSCSVTAATSLRAPLGNVVEDSSPKMKIFKRRLLASEFQSGNPEHLKLVKEMGINLQSLPDGRIQLLHTFANALSQDDAEEGLMFMQEMIDLSKQVQSQDSPPKQVTYREGGSKIALQAGPAQFGPSLKHPAEVTGRLVLAQDSKACIGSLQNGEDMKGNIVLVERGDCMFIEKARVIQSMGGIGGIVMDTAEGSAASASPIFAMSGDGSDDVSIPMVFLFSKEADQLMKAKTDNPDLEVTLEEKSTSQKSGRACMANQKSDELADLIYQNMESANIYWFSNNRLQCSYLQYYKNKIILDPEPPLSILQRDIRFLGVNYGQILNPDLPARELYRDVKRLGVNHGPVIRLRTPDTSELSDIETDLDKLRNEVQSRFEELNEKLILFKIKQRVQGLDNEDSSKLGKLGLKVVDNVNNLNNKIIKITEVQQTNKNYEPFPSIKERKETLPGRKLLSFDDIEDLNMDLMEEENLAYSTVDDDETKKEINNQNTKADSAVKAVEHPSNQKDLESADVLETEDKSIDTVKDTADDKDHDTSEKEDPDKSDEEDPEESDDDLEAYDKDVIASNEDLEASDEDLEAYDEDLEASDEDLEISDEEDLESEEEDLDWNAVENLERFLKSPVKTEEKFKEINKYTSEIMETNLNELSKEFYEEIVFTIFDFLYFSDTLNFHIDYQNEALGNFELAAQKVAPLYKSLSHFTDQYVASFDNFTSKDLFQGNASILVAETNTFILNYHYAGEVLRIIEINNNSFLSALSEHLGESFVALDGFYTELLQMVERIQRNKDRQYLHDEDYEYSNVENLEEEGIEEYITEDDLEIQDVDNEVFKMAFNPRKLLSVDEETCSKDDPDCNAAHHNSFTEGLNKDSSVDEPGAEETKSESDIDHEQENKDEHINDEISVQSSLVERCQKFQIEVSASKKVLKKKLKDPKSKREELNRLRTAMKELKVTMHLLQTYQKLAIDMTNANQNDRQLCQTILQGSMDHILNLQKKASDSNIMDMMSSLLGSTDPYIVDSLNAMMEEEMDGLLGMN